MKKNVLILGGGSREHALARTMSKSKKIKNIFVGPGNAGTSSFCINVDINSETSFDQISNFINEEEIDFVIPGSEAYLAKGITNYLDNTTEACIVGPTVSNSRLESSKLFAKNFMKKRGIPTSKFKYFLNYNSARDYINSNNSSPPYVIKLDGLNSGKGVFIEKSRPDALKRLEKIFDQRSNKYFEKPVLIEEFLKGTEVSFFVLSDGDNYILLPEAKDYKQINEGNKGLNTGGMGSISPVPFVDEMFIGKVKRRIIEPTLKDLNYKGFLYFGLMNVDGDPYVIEYNVRLGDPEASVVLSRIQNDFIDLLINFENKDLNKTMLRTDLKFYSSVIISSKGYPESFESNKAIHIPDQKECNIFHCSTKEENRQLYSNGGRVLCVMSSDSSLKKSLEKSYNLIENINFSEKYYRSDIGFEFL